MKYLLIFAVILIWGCGPQPELTSTDQTDGSWNYSEPMSFGFDIKDTTAVYDLVLSLEYSAEFSYQNVYVKIETTYPDDKKIEDIVSLNIMDNGGVFLGDCDSKICQTDIALQSSFRFKSEGEHQFKIFQHSRKSDLEGVFGAELKLFRKEIL